VFGLVGLCQADEAHPRPVCDHLLPAHVDLDHLKRLVQDPLLHLRCALDLVLIGNVSN